MTKITFNPELHHRPNALGQHSIKIRMTQDRKHKRVEIGYDIEKKHWNPKKKEVRSIHPLHALINAAIKAKIRDFETKCLTAIVSGENTTIDKVLGQKEIGFENSFLNYFSEYLKTLQPSSKITMNSVYNKLKAFKNNISFEDFNPEFVESIRIFLSEKGNIPTTIGLNFIVIKKVYRDGVKAAKINLNKVSPFGELSIKKGKRKIRTKHNVDEIKLMEDAEILLDSPSNIRINNARNIYLLCYYLMGVRIGSMMKMKWSNIQGDRCIYNAAKGGKAINAKIGSKAREILDFYEKTKTKQDDYIFPYLNEIKIENTEAFIVILKNRNVEITRRLNELSALIGLDKKITPHGARHSFAYNARRASNNDIYAVQKALGHSDIVTTQRYFATDETIEADALTDLMFN